MRAFPRQRQEKEDNTISRTIFSTHLGPLLLSDYRSGASGFGVVIVVSSPVRAL